MKIVSALMTLVFVLAACGDEGSAGGGGSVAGSYELDRDYYRESIFTTSTEQNPKWSQMPEAAKKQIKATLESEVSAARLNLELKSDDGFDLSGLVGGQSIEARGTYVRDGNEITMTTTHRNGIEVSDEKVTLELEDDALLMDSEGNDGIKIRLIKK